MRRRAPRALTKGESAARCNVKHGITLRWKPTAKAGEAALVSAGLMRTGTRSATVRTVYRSAKQELEELGRFAPERFLRCAPFHASGFLEARSCAGGIDCEGDRGLVVAVGVAEVHRERVGAHRQCLRGQNASLCEGVRRRDTGERQIT
jgi:hypothetical protein